MNPYPEQIIIDQKFNVLKVLLSNGEWWTLKGYCSRCGKCCERGNCDYYGRELLNGKDVARCEAQVYGKKPAYCTIYPSNPYEKLMDTCTYYWEKI